MAEALISNLLHDDLPQRDMIETAVRDVIQSLDGGKRVVTLSTDNSLAPGRVSVRVRQPDGALAFTSMAIEDTREDIVDRLNALFR